MFGLEAGFRHGIETYRLNSIQFSGNSTEFSRGKRMRILDQESESQRCNSLGGEVTVAGFGIEL